MEMSSNYKIVKKNVKKAWVKYHQINALRLKTPNEILVKMTSPILNELSYVVDFGSGSLNNSAWFAKNGIKTLSLDYAFKKKKFIQKNLNYKNIDITETKKLDFLKKKEINLLIIHQFIDHIYLKDAFKILNFVKNNLKIKYIFISFLTTKCRGPQVVGKISNKKSYLSPISGRMNSKLKELHTFYSKKNINKALNIFNNFKIDKQINITETYIDNFKKKNLMSTDHYLLKKNVFSKNN